MVNVKSTMRVQVGLKQGAPAQGLVVWTFTSLTPSSPRMIPHRNDYNVHEALIVSLDALSVFMRRSACSGSDEGDFAWTISLRWTDARTLFIGSSEHGPGCPH